MEAEELKQNYIRYHRTAAGKHKGVSLEFANEIEMNSFLQLYADEQSREKAVNFALFSIYEYSAGIDVRSTDVDNLYDYWKSNQDWCDSF